MLDVILKSFLLVFSQSNKTEFYLHRSANNRYITSFAGFLMECGGELFRTVLFTVHV